MPAEYLTLDGVPIAVRAPGGGGLAEPERSGELLRMHDNSLTSSENPTQQKRVWNFQTPALSYADWAVIEPLLKGGIIRSADGYAITRAAGAVAVYVRRADLVHEPTSDTDFGYSVRFSLLEAYGLVTGGTQTEFWLVNDTSPDDDGSGSYPSPDGGPGVLKLIRTTPLGPFEGVGLVPTAAMPIECVTEGCVGRCDETVTVVQRWRSKPYNSALLDGFPHADVLASFAASSPWARMVFSGLFTILRAGVVVGGPYQCLLYAPDFSGGIGVLSTVSPIVFLLEDGDQVEFALTVVMALKACATDDGNRPQALTGAALWLPGTVTEAP